MVEKKTRAKKAKGGCLVGLKGVHKGCKIGRTAPRNVGKEGMNKKKAKPMTKKPTKPLRKKTQMTNQELEEMERRRQDDKRAKVASMYVRKKVNPKTGKVVKPRGKRRVGAK
tara:strand:- start:538 stop:873 length:336 start_codon:yes stop_codon:yes gene_type:complete